MMHGVSLIFEGKFSLSGRGDLPTVGWPRKERIKQELGMVELSGAIEDLLVVLDMDVYDGPFDQATTLLLAILSMPKTVIHRVMVVSDVCMGTHSDVCSWKENSCAENSHGQCLEKIRTPCLKVTSAKKDSKWLGSASNSTNIHDAIYLDTRCRLSILQQVSDVVDDEAACHFFQTKGKMVVFLQVGHAATPKPTKGKLALVLQVGHVVAPKPTQVDTLLI
ncbi:hypothetical protein VNO77_19788 [Canavalia gladiata]|uniref:Uncharacterized protein n=1 Tax=Canavalia gladiata TaxID=3824 RepID=A0AAN9QIT5_CANGL